MKGSVTTILLCLVLTTASYAASINGMVLNNLATQAEKQKRQTATQAGIGANTKMEIVNAQYWILKAAQDEIDILAYNRSLLGYIPQPSGSMSA